jgi:hypothetical protein
MAFGQNEIIGFFNQWLDGLWCRFKPEFYYYSTASLKRAVAVYISRQKKRMTSLA